MNTQLVCNIQSHLVRRFFSQPQSHQESLGQISAMIEQNRILKNIQEQIQSRNSCNKILTEGDLNESMSLSSSSIIFRPTLSKFIQRKSDHSSFWDMKGDKMSTNTTLDDDIKIKRVSNPKIIPEAEIERAMNDVQNSCDFQTIRVIRHLYARTTQITKKLREKEDIIEAFEKNKKKDQQLKIAQMDYQRKIFDYQNKIRGLESQNNNLKENNTVKRIPLETNSQRQKQLSKMEISLALKQKLISEDTKKITNKINLLKKQEADVQQNKKQVDEIWENIINNLDVPGEQFKANVYQKCKQNLMIQKKHLQQQQIHLDSQHEYIQKIIGQMQTIL